ncbi:glycosyltransferase involved in cell wall biosynthesis [Oceanihabitans sediminis]|uniref:Glycosyltransferase n=1 Tax=Oceanihabitans sediminis TaxID=1812012 RepID=A0A368P165_9FLAO|nr:glycosyltransferase [Oceanihabitans sediminis]RBP28399.1 glycosyltransferase involved in cell wall biosynthesis [Oceanihabitans sediminis]RCU56597.1 glycosyltransferase [Oceanihabitans sediminis]
MHILKIIHGYPPNYNAGSEVYSQSICNQLSKDHRVSVFTREQNPYAPDFQIRHDQVSENLNLYFVNNPNGKDGYRHQPMDDNFKELVEQLNPDVAHVGHLNHLSTGLIDVLNTLQIPIVFTLHDFWLMCPRGQFLTRSIGKECNTMLCSGQEDKKCATSCYQVYFSGNKEEEQIDIDNWSNWVNRRMQETKAIIDKVDLFIAPSKYLQDRFVTDFNVPTSKIIYLDYGFPTHYLTQTEKVNTKEVFTFGYIGTHIPAKGIDQLIQAFKQVKTPAVLKIYGRDNGQSTAALKALATNSENTVEFMGEYINHNLANDVFAHVDCIVVPSIWGENSPLVIHEAQACKIPVITADFGGMKEYVQHQVNGLLFKHRDVNALAEQLNFAVTNPDKMKAYGAKGYLYSQNGSVPDIKEHCDKLISIYKRYTNPGKFWRITIDTNPEDCNLKCIMCEEHSPYSDFIDTLYKETGIKRRRMDFETVQQIFEQASALGVKEIIPSTMGEPLLYKQFDQIFDLAKQHGIKINLTTNGTFPKKSVLDWAKLIVPNTTDVKISWNGATAETSKKVMHGLDFEKAIANVKEFIAYRDWYFKENGYFCRVTWQLTFMQNNMHELTDIIKLAASLGVDRVKGHQLWDHFDEIKALSMKATPESVKQWNIYVKEAHAAAERYRKPNGERVLLENIVPIEDNELKVVPEDYECPFLEKELWISATGKISPCCAPDNLRQSLGDFGNIKTDSIQDVLKSERYTDLVQNYKTKDVCKTCVMRKPV